MQFDELDARMRVFETAHDHCVLPGMHIVLRLDGRGFTRFTKDVMAFERPFDVRFRDVMVQVVEHLMQADLHALYGYTQSDEISLLLHPQSAAFGRKERKLNSVTAGEASGVASLLFGRAVAFDCRVCQLPAPGLVVDYFRWRQEDAHRNALSSHCYWRSREEGASPERANDEFAGASTAAKNEWLFQRGINYDALPAWQKRGVGCWWRTVEVAGRDPRTGIEVPAMRRRLHRELELPRGQDYDALLRSVMTD